MKIEEIKELIQAMEHSELTSLEVVEGESCVRMEKQQKKTEMVQSQPIVTIADVAPQTSVVQEAPKMEFAAPKGNPVKCPLVGVFYAAPSPDDAPFVTEGASVKKGDILCIVEAMKLMNEIVAEQDGTIAQVCVKNGDVVEFGQPLFYIV